LHIKSFSMHSSPPKTHSKLRRNRLTKKSLMREIPVANEEFLSRTQNFEQYHKNPHNDGNLNDRHDSLMDFFFSVHQ
jgi:hypothetical protein